MDIAVLTFDGFNELDSFIASAMINRARKQGLNAWITAPSETVTSMNGVEVRAQRDLSFARDADAVLIGSGIKSREIAADDAFLKNFELDPGRQFIGSQCSGALVLQALGLAGGPVCTDTMTRPFLEKQGVSVLDRAFHAAGTVATAGGCLSSSHLAAWVIGSLADWQTAYDIVHYVAPIGRKDALAQEVEAAVKPYLAGLPAAAAE